MADPLDQVMDSSLENLAAVSFRSLMFLTSLFSKNPLRNLKEPLTEKEKLEAYQHTVMMVCELFVEKFQKVALESLETTVAEKLKKLEDDNDESSNR
jgi:hypothetical protein